MSYNPTNWVNGETPINDSNLNHIEQGIKDVADLSDAQESKIADIANNQIPETYLQQSVDNYIANNQAGLATKTELAELDSKLSSEIEEYCDVRKCFDETNLYNGFLNVDNGQVINNASWKCTDFIACSLFDRILCAYSNGADLVALCFYDENKNYIGKHFASTSRQPFEYIVTQANVKYVRYNVFPANIFPYSAQYIDIVSNKAISKSLEQAITSCRQFSTVESVVSDYANLDTLPINSIITYSAQSLSALIEKPFNVGFTIVTFNSITNSYSGATQIAWSLDNGTCKTRVNAGTWTEWKSNSSIVEPSNVYYVGKTRSGKGTFTTLKACTEYITSNNIYNATVYLDAETFDLVSEFGTDYLDSIESETNKGFGLKIGNNTHFVFAEGSKVLFDYQGTNEDCAEYFSAFNVIGSFTIENADIEVTNARYCVHEDLPTSADSMPNSYIAKYVNCNMKHNGNNFGGYTGTVCIGGGTYKNSLSIFENGKYICGTQFPYAISYHNYGGSYPSKVVLKNVWVNNGVRFADFGTNPVSVEMSGCYIPNGYTKGNYFDITEWNNTINK